MPPRDDVTGSFYVLVEDSDAFPGDAPGRAVLLTATAFGPPTQAVCIALLAASMTTFPVDAEFTVHDALVTR